MSANIYGTINNYKQQYNFHSNLYSAFIKRCYDLCSDDGYIAIIHTNTLMFISSFESSRKFIVNNTSINIMVEYGLDRVNLFGTGILLDAMFYVLNKNSSDEKSLFIDMSHGLQEKYKKNMLSEVLNDVVSSKDNNRVYFVEQKKFSDINTAPFIYWISDDFRHKFKDLKIGDVYKNCQGLATADNNRFLRYWWEVGDSNIYTINSNENNVKWYLYAKGGPYRKWHGNNWLAVNWADDGKEIRGMVDTNGKQRSRPQNESFYFKEGITYSASGGRKTSYRILPKNCIFDVKGSSIFPLKKGDDLFYLLAVLNSKLSNYVIGCLNPTVEIQVGDIKRIPYVKPSEKIEKIITKLASTNIAIKKEIDTYSICEFSYEGSPVARNQNEHQIRQRIKDFLEYENNISTQLLINDAVINNCVFDTYNLSDQDKAMVLTKEGNSIGGLSVTAQAKEAYLSRNETTNEFPLNAIHVFIESLPTRDFSPEEQDAIENEFPALYQNNNDLEEFCIRHQVNPINVWYWFKQSNVLPKQRMNDLAMEFLADMIREILMEDEDGIIPLVANAGEKILLDRIEEKFREKGFTTAQYASFDSVLGRPLNDYLNTTFFAALSDHLNLFMYLPKTPFIWHLSSGPEQGFDCYIIIYKWSRDKLLRIRSVYIEHRERALMNRQSDLANNDSADAQNEKEKIFKQLKEIEAFKVKIDELLAEGYNPILDDGVGKNIAPLQKKKMIPYEVLNPGQLKKYLNADW